MPHRQFHDPNGTLWTVWDVVPERVEQSLASIGPAPTPAAPAAPATSRLGPSLLALDVRWASGWLCFESGIGKRRLAPVPLEWEQLPIERLVALCERADVVPARRAAV